jgi:hypothetical protein
LGFRGGDEIRWLLTYGLVLLFATPLRGVDIWFDGRGRRLRHGWGKAAGIHSGGNQSFDSCDHRKSLDLAGDDAPGHFVAKSG